VADALEASVGSDAVGELLDLRDAFVAALGDDVCGAEVARQGLSVRVPAHRDDSLGTELGSGQDAGQAHRPVAYHHDSAAGSDVCAHCGMPTGAHDIGKREDARYDVVARVFGGGEERAIGVLHADQLCLAAVVPGDTLAVGVGAHLADWAGVVAGEEPADNELPGVHRAHLVADRFNDADVLVADRCRFADLLDPAIAPQVRPAHARCDRANDGVRRLGDGRVGTLLEADITGAVDDRAAHEDSPES
jgi:hypothetical protein